MSPLKVLTRGYSLATAQDGTVIRSITQTKVGQEIGVRLADGTLTALITDVKEI
jgi:exodeoxyribonuclease VII large subunit